MPCDKVTDFLWLLRVHLSLRRVFSPSSDFPQQCLLTAVECVVAFHFAK